ncbi:hypothetical protein V6N11_066042 [Hibiscus sabdariffa]|uniref:Uncharacterized protein n=1 Tax=Hibiscus sabdariffa TaxID=183260 RepID=A0ABR2NUK2_9ROSI
MVGQLNQSATKNLVKKLQVQSGVIPCLDGLNSMGDKERQKPETVGCGCVENINRTIISSIYCIRMYLITADDPPSIPPQLFSSFNPFSLMTCLRVS